MPLFCLLFSFDLLAKRELSDKIYFKQMRAQLFLLNLKHGMLINFKVNLMKDGIHRIFNNFGRESLK